MIDASSTRKADNGLASGRIVSAGMAALQDRRVRPPLFVLLTVAAATATFVLLFSLGRPLGDMHSFRQSQTAISVYWMLHGAPWVDYWTPVLGAPWAIPFEFPFYQWIVAVAVRLTGIPIDDAGRVVGFLWLIIGLFPAKRFFDELNLPPSTFIFYATLTLASPLYLFWGRAFLIETQAVTLGLFFLLFCSRFIAGCSPINGFYGVIFGILAGLTKITTLLPFCCAIGVITVLALYDHKALRGRLIILSKAIAVCLPALVAFEIWNAHTDALKSANPLAMVLRSEELSAWNFGSVTQRFSLSLVIANVRAMIDLFGWGAAVILPVLGWAAARHRFARRTYVLIALAIGLYAVPWLIVTNLHIVHNYYQCANGVFMIAAVAIVLGALEMQGQTWLVSSIFVALMISQYARFTTSFMPAIISMAETKRERAIAEILKERTKPGDIIAVYGLQWSPFLPWAAERRARMEAPRTTIRQYRSRLPRPGEIIDNAHITALVRCPSVEENDPVASARFAEFASGAETVMVDDCRIDLRPYF